MRVLLRVQEHQIRHRDQEFHISSSSLQRILTEDLHLHAYTVQLTQRREFVEWIMEKQQVDAGFSNKIKKSRGLQLIVKIVAFAAQKIHELRKKCIHSVSLFGVDFGL